VELLFIQALLFLCGAMAGYVVCNNRIMSTVHLPAEIKEQLATGAATEANAGLKGMLSAPAHFIDRFLYKVHFMPIEILDKIKIKLVNAGKPINASQFLAVKVIAMALIPFVTYTFMPQANFTILLVCLAAGYILPEFWLATAVKKRQAQILKDMPHVIELMNICVCSGLDFMVAVTRVTRDYRQCPIVDELTTMIHEIQMGSSRRDALKNLAIRINSPEMSSFVLTLLQTDRMGTPIGKILKAQAEEIRTRRFQKGEEMALKAPIKLLFPLLFFIMPVVLIIVAGPILIQFLYGGFKF
jgi:tight adherence protein C